MTLEMKKSRRADKKRKAKVIQIRDFCLKNKISFISLVSKTGYSYHHIVPALNGARIPTPKFYTALYKAVLDVLLERREEIINTILPIEEQISALNNITAHDD